jgi:hypothetical protein
VENSPTQNSKEPMEFSNFRLERREGCSVKGAQIVLENSKLPQARLEETRQFVGGQALGRWPLSLVSAAFIERQVLFDVGFLCFVYFLSTGLYATRLGLYSDDWAHLAVLELRGDLSGYSVIEYLMENSVSPRPIHYLWLATLHRIFGLAPLGYHLANSAVLLANTLLFYFCLRELRLPRVGIIAIPAIYITVPTYSTVHFWIATFETPISMAFYFLSLYCDLRTLRANRVQAWLLKVVSAGALVGSALAYEFTIPLFLLNPFLFWLASKQYALRSSKIRPRSLPWRSLARNVVFIAVIVAYKKSVRPDLVNYSAIKPLHLLHTLFRRNWTEADFGFNIWQFVDVDLFERGLKLPLLAVKASKYVHWPELVTTGMLGVIGFAYLCLVSPSRAGSYDRRFICPNGWLELSAAGVAAALAGYAVFLIGPNLQFTIAGIMNRASMAAAAGLAVFLIGVIGHLTCNLPGERLRRIAFALLASSLIASGCMVKYAIASHWIAAYRHEGEILRAIQARFPALPEGATFILDGICPYIGPAIVFESRWDLTGALQLLYRDPALRADVVTPRLQTMQDGLRATIYGVSTDYPYGRELIIYNIRYNVERHLVDRRAAEAYFAEFGRDRENRCIWGHESTGAPIF